MEQRRILVVDDDEEVRAFLEMILGGAGFEVLAVADAAEAELEAATFKPDLVITDLILPGLNGVDLARHLCDQGRRPVLIISGMSNEGGVLSSAAGAAGAREFLAKPLTEQALFNSITRLLGSEPAPADHEPPIERGPLRLDPERRLVWLNGEPLSDLGPKRFDLLRFLMRRPEGACRRTLLKEVWGEAESPKIVDVTVHRLRRDLKPLGDRVIVVIPGGYKLVV